MEVNIFRDIDCYTFNYHYTKLDPTTKIILKDTIEQQYIQFKIYLESIDFKNESKFKNYVYGIFSDNPLEHCLINYYIQHIKSVPNKYNSSGLISYLINIGFIPNMELVLKQVYDYDPSIKINPHDYYLYKFKN